MIYTCFDIESTSKYPTKADPIQFAAIQFDESFSIIRSSNFFIKPARGIWSTEAESVHGISKFFLAEHGVEPEVAAASIYALFCSSNLVGYNSRSYDWEAISTWMQHLGCPIPPISTHADVMREWQHRLGKRQKLVDLTANLNYPSSFVSALTSRYFTDRDETRPHDACYDVMATFLCWKDLQLTLRKEARERLRKAGLL